jgi:cell division septal protein FtsQ
VSKKKPHSKGFLKGKLTGLLWAGAVLLFLGAAVYAGLYLEQQTVITDVRFSGHHFTSEDQLHSALVSPVGIRADSVRFEEHFDQLKELPYVKNVTVSMSYRGTLTFSVDEHEPAAMAIENGTRTYISEDGDILPIVEGKIVDVPLLYGFSTSPAGQKLSGERFTIVSEFLKAAKANPTGWITISEISWNGSEGVVALSQHNGVKLIFGKNGFDEKFENWEAFYSQVIGVQGMGELHTVDLRFADQIVTRTL